MSVKCVFYFRHELRLIPPAGIDCSRERGFDTSAQLAESERLKRVGRPPGNEQKSHGSASNCRTNKTASSRGAGAAILVAHLN